MQHIINYIKRLFIKNNKIMVGDPVWVRYCEYFIEKGKVLNVNRYGYLIKMNNIEEPKYIDTCLVYKSFEDLIKDKMEMLLRKYYKDN